MSTDYSDRFDDTLQRLLPETYNLMSVQAALEALKDSHTGVILAQSFSALMGDRLVRLIRILENSDRTATFWYLYNCEPANVSKGIDIRRLQDLSEKLRLVRNKTLFHIDKDHVGDSEAVYKQANIIANEVIWAMETIWCVLNRLYAERTGQPWGPANGIDLSGMREIFQRDAKNMREKGVIRG